jgi:hypothetical protein
MVTRALVVVVVVAGRAFVVVVAGVAGAAVGAGAVDGVGSTAGAGVDVEVDGPVEESAADGSPRFITAAPAASATNTAHAMTSRRKTRVTAALSASAGGS